MLAALLLNLDDYNPTPALNEATMTATIAITQQVLSL